MTVLGSEFKEVWNNNCKVNNKVAAYEGFTISFLPWHDHDSPAVPETKDGETSLNYDGNYLILNGDWCLTYAELAPNGLDACIAFFNSKSAFKSSWSD